MPRPGKYIEYDFPLHEVNRLAVKEANAKKPIYTIHKWWARRLSCVFRTILLASGIDWEKWDALENWKRDEDGRFVCRVPEGAGDEEVPEGLKAGGEFPATMEEIAENYWYHWRVRDESPSPEWNERTKGLLDRRPTAWERLYYRLDDEANEVIREAFEGKTVLDPFMGGGTTVVEALRLGANVVGVDLNPVAWFITKKATDGCDLDELEKGFKQVEALVADEIRSYYKTTCPCCGEQADVMYVFWVKLAKCQEQTCGATVPLYNSFILAKKKGGKRGADVPRDKQGRAGMKVAEGGAKGVNFIVCEDCGEIYASKEHVDRHGTTCPTCGHSFEPADGYAGHGSYTCHECGTKAEILDAAKAEGRLPYRMYGVELYCPECKFKGYRKALPEDERLFERARADFERTRDALNLPDQEIPPGYNTYVGNPLPGHGFHKWTDMFNERQLLLLAKLRDAILEVQDRNVREYLLLAFSAMLRSHNMFCRYQRYYCKIDPLFAIHAYHPPNDCVENNVWGAEYGQGTFANGVDLVAKGISWAGCATDNLFRSDSEYERFEVADGIYAGSRTAHLAAVSADELSVLAPPEAGLAVTDPPYYGNVMYSELSDFFYVWVRSALENDYPEEFGPLLTPKEEEIVEQVTRGHGAPFLHKDHEFFVSSLTRCFNEAGEHLVDDGLLVFTFHHQADEAWTAVLRTVLDDGFYVDAVYPVHGEKSSSLHIIDKANISYDAVIVCRKQRKPEKTIQWTEVENRVWGKAQRLVKELDVPGRRLAPEDVYVIVIGKCLEEYSRHCYKGQSFVVHRGRPVGIEAALTGDDRLGIDGIGAIVDQLVEEMEGRRWPSGLDPITRFYCVNLVGQSEVPHDRLHRRLQSKRNVDLDELAKRKLIKPLKGKHRVLDPMDRAEWLEARLGGESTPALFDDSDVGTTDELSSIDRIHWLYIADRRGMLIGDLMQQWGKNATFRQLNECIVQNLGEKAHNYSVYKRVAELVKGAATGRLMEA